MPDGAPEKVRDQDLPAPENDKSFAYLWQSQHMLQQADTILLASDNDSAGHALAEELARRLGVCAICTRCTCFDTLPPPSVCKCPPLDSWLRHCSRHVLLGSATLLASDSNLQWCKSSLSCMQLSCMYTASPAIPQQSAPMLLASEKGSAVRLQQHPAEMCMTCMQRGCCVPVRTGRERQRGSSGIRSTSC